MTHTTDSLKVPRGIQRRILWSRIAGTLALLILLTFLFVKFSTPHSEKDLFSKEIYLSLDESYASAAYQQKTHKSIIDDLASFTVLHDLFAYDKNFIYVFNQTKIPYQSPEERKKIERLFLETAIGKNPYYETLFTEWDIDDIQLLTQTYNPQENES